MQKDSKQHPLGHFHMYLSMGVFLRHFFALYVVCFFANRRFLESGPGVCYSLLVHWTAERRLAIVGNATGQTNSGAPLQLSRVDVTPNDS